MSAFRDAMRRVITGYTDTDKNTVLCAGRQAIYSAVFAPRAARSADIRNWPFKIQIIDGSGLARSKKHFLAGAHRGRPTAENISERGALFAVSRAWLTWSKCHTAAPGYPRRLVRTLLPIARFQHEIQNWRVPWMPPLRARHRMNLPLRTPARNIRDRRTHINHSPGRDLRLV